jgi:hypothetical protein
MTTFTGSGVEQAAVARPESIGWSVGVEIGPGEAAAERDADGQVVLVRRLRKWARGAA